MTRNFEKLNYSFNLLFETSNINALWNFDEMKMIFGHSFENNFIK